MGVIITVANQKGGVGKTATVAALAYILYEKGYRVLSVNTDPQRNLDMLAGENVPIDKDDLTTYSLLHVLKGECAAEDAIVKTDIGDLIRASSQLSSWIPSVISAEELHTNKHNPSEVIRILENRFSHDYSNWHLAKALNSVKNNYDYILIDTNPSLGPLPINAFLAADYMLIPVFSEDSSKTALADLYASIQYLKLQNPAKYLEIVGLLMTNCKMRTIVHRRYEDAYKEIAAMYDTILFKTKIRSSVPTMECMEARENIVKYHPKGTTAQDYIRFANEFLARIKYLESKRVKYAFK